MEKIERHLIQDGFNLERLREDSKIDREAYIILKKRNLEALKLLKQ